MTLRKFRSVYLELKKIRYVKRFIPEIRPESAVPSEQSAGVRIGFANTEVTFYEDEPGYEEFINWLEAEAK